MRRFLLASIVTSLLGLVSLARVFGTLRISLAQDSPALTITSFPSDLTQITPDQAESGTQFATLTWATNRLRPTDHAYLQVFVLGEWHNIRLDALPASGTLRWAVAHTLDFAPPRFRLVVRDASDHEAQSSELVIPYTTGIDPANPPQITQFTVDGTPASNGPGQYGLGQPALCAGSGQRGQRTHHQDRAAPCAGVDQLARAGQTAAIGAG